MNNYPDILNSLSGYSQANDYIQNHRDIAIEKLSKYYPNCDSMKSLNGIIGGKNSTYNVNADNCTSHIEYYLQWKCGHFTKYKNDSTLPFERTSINIYIALQDRFLEEFVAVYLSRTYFKKHNIR